MALLHQFHGVLHEKWEPKVWPLVVKQLALNGKTLVARVSERVVTILLR